MVAELSLAGRSVPKLELGNEIKGDPPGRPYG
jgi:hypothetical protein